MVTDEKTAWALPGSTWSWAHSDPAVRKIMQFHLHALLGQMLMSAACN